jgi:hypothetical protein
VAKHKVLDERTLQVLWAIARNGHATEKVIMGTLRRHDVPVRNRHDLYRSLQKLLHHSLISYEGEFNEYVLLRKNVYSCRDLEKERYAKLLHLWDKIKDEHEFHRAFGTPPL